MSLDDPRSAARIAEDDKLIEEKFQRDLQFVRELGAKWEIAKADGVKSMTTGFFGMTDLRISDAGYEIFIADPDAKPADHESAEWFARKLRENGFNAVVAPRKMGADADDVDSLLR